MHYRFALFAPLTLHKSNIKKYSLFVSSISFRKIKMNYKTILLCPTSNKWQTRRYQIYEKHFSTDPYNFLFVYVFKFLSVLAFCRWMSFMFTIKDIIASKETIKSKLPNFQIIFWRSPCSWLLHQDWNNCDEMLLVRFLLLWLSR